MAVLLFEPRFWEPIVQGEKVHSIRRKRKRPIVGETELSLRGWEGKAYRSRQRVLIEVTCLASLPIWIDSIVIHIAGYGLIDEDDRDEFARSDGFDSWDGMRNYLDVRYGLPFSGDFIQWGEHRLLNRIAGTLRWERPSATRNLRHKEGIK